MKYDIKQDLLKFAFQKRVIKRAFINKTKLF